MKKLVIFGVAVSVVIAIAVLAVTFSTKHGLAQVKPVSYTHLRAHETVLDLVCRLLLEKKKH